MHGIGVLTFVVRGLSSLWWPTELTLVFVHEDGIGAFPSHIFRASKPIVVDTLLSCLGSERPRPLASITI